MVSQFDDICVAPVLSAETADVLVTRKTRRPPPVRFAIEVSSELTDTASVDRTYDQVDKHLPDLAFKAQYGADLPSSRCHINSRIEKAAAVNRNDTVEQVCSPTSVGFVVCL